MEEQTELLKIVSEKKKEEYPAVIEARASYPFLYHLSEVRENLISSLPLRKGMRVLELHGECGALTGKLLEMTGDVTAVTENAQNAEIIKVRNQGKAGLRVVTEEEFWRNTPQAVQKGLAAEGEGVFLRNAPQAVQKGLAAKGEKASSGNSYDVILVVGKTYEAAARFPLLKTLLAEGGRIFLADANRLGLKYFAGCQEEYAGGFFSGAEGYPDGRRERCYSRKEYEALFLRNGFEILRWYYPYPDYKFPAVVYSDRWQPGQGELSDNRRNFDKDRYQLFEERRVFDTILSEGLFPEFSNSYLMEAYISGQGAAEKKELLYTKYSNERAKEFAIRTEAVQEPEGKIMVHKIPLYPEGERHIDHIREAYERLMADCSVSEIAFCGCEKQENAVCFPFVEGLTLQDVMEEALRQGEKDRVRAILEDYVRRIRENGETIPFVMTEEFRRVFGEASFQAGKEAARVCDIDLIFPNILVPEADVRSGKQPKDWNWTVIDYEWTFFFPMPKAFVLYRAMYFTYYQILNDTDWELQELMELAGITEPMQQSFMEMERQFQRYLGKGAVPVRNLQRKMGTKIISLENASGAGDEGELFIREEEWLRVRKIYFHIDRVDYQDGSAVCSGWALAKVKDGRTLPVHIRVTDKDGKEMSLELHRKKRKDVAETLKIRHVTNPEFGFDCVWIAPPGEKWNLHFSLGNCEKIFETAAL